MATADPAQLKISDASRLLALFAKQLTVLLASGVQLTRALDVLGEQFESPVFSQVVRDVSQKVSCGYSLSRALGVYPRVFSKVFTGLVQAGESTGKLSDSLSKLSGMLEKEHQMRQRLSAALVYPIFVLATTFILTLFVFYTVLPNFIEIFRSMHVRLPFVTRALIFLTDAIRNPGYWLIAAGIAMMSYLMYCRMKATPGGRLTLYRVLMRIPIAGPIVRYASLARYCWVLESVIGSGMELLVSLRLAAGASGSPEVEVDLDIACQNIRMGGELSSHYARHPEIYTSLTGQMILAAEETSAMETSFERLATWFAQEMESRVDLLNAIIEPVLMSVLAIVVGTIVIAIFLPLYAYLGTMGA